MSYIDEHYSQSMNDMQMILPCIENWLGCEITLIEKDNGPIECALDTMCGIDAFAFKSGIKGLAMRCQWGSWDTFTLRYQRATGNPTEFQKFDTNNLRPNYTMQIYLREGEITIGCAEYDRLMQYAKDNAERLAADAKTANKEGNKFLVINFADLEQEPWFKKSTVECDGCRRKAK